MNILKRLKPFIHNTLAHTRQIGQGILTVLLLGSPLITVANCDFSIYSVKDRQAHLEIFGLEFYQDIYKAYLEQVPNIDQFLFKLKKAEKTTSSYGDSCARYNENTGLFELPIVEVTLGGQQTFYQVKMAVESQSPTGEIIFGIWDASCLANLVPVEEESIPNQLVAGSPVMIVWKIENLSSCDATEYRLAFDSATLDSVPYLGSSFGRDSHKVTTIYSNETQTIAAEFIVPKESGDFNVCFNILNKNDNPLPSLLGGKLCASFTVTSDSKDDNQGSNKDKTSDLPEMTQAELVDPTIKHDKVPPGQAKKIAYDGAELDISAGAVDRPTDVGIKPLDDTSDDMPQFAFGMINVTQGKNGYRFLPKGMKFNKKIHVGLPYDKNKLPSGKTEQDINTFYFDTELNRWIPLDRSQVDSKTGMIISETDHFTYMANCVLMEADTPEPVAAIPYLAEKRAADPSRQINVIEAPTFNQNGNLRLSYPIEVTPGRADMQPQLAVQYTSSAYNSWLGLGWDLPMPAITIDTRWGVPRYQADKETETYLLEGEQLTPLVHRNAELQPRSAEKVFHTRREEQFRKIIRHGDNPTNYWWEVTDKEGTVYYYGGDSVTNGPTDESTLTDAQGNLFKWALREIRDTNGNHIQYRHERVMDVGLPQGHLPGYELYLKTIQYTGHNNQPGPYQVSFIRDRELNEPRRPDITISGIGGFKQVTADLLRKIELTVNGQPIRSYQFNYQLGAFQKTLLTSITQYGEDGSVFNTHRFDYYDESRNADGNYKGFAAAIYWGAENDSLSACLAELGEASALGSTLSQSNGETLLDGMSGNGDKSTSTGKKTGSKNTNSEGKVALVDINGDLLPDILHKKADGVYYCPNQSGPEGSPQFGAPRRVIGLPDILIENSSIFIVGAELHDNSADAGVNYDQTFTRTPVYLSDVNGDGLVDLVHHCEEVLYNRLNANGEPTFAPDNAGTPYPIDPGANIDVPDGLFDGLKQQYEEQLDLFPLLDTVRRFLVPYDGMLQISGDVALIEDSNSVPTADGVRVAIQHNDTELWATSIAADDYSLKTPTNVETIDVNQDDVIYFRVQSIFDGNSDQVSWSPVIQYLNVSSAIDANQLDAYQYSAATDFAMSGHRDLYTSMPFNGRVRMIGELQKLAVTTDDITLLLLKNDQPIWEQTLTWDQVGSITLSGIETEVAKTDRMAVWVKIDSPIDLSKLAWNNNLLKLEYLSSPEMTDAQRAKLGQIELAWSYDTYPQSDSTLPLTPWTAPKSGPIIVNPLLATFYGDVTTNGTVTMTVKRRGERVAKHFITIENGAVNNGSFEFAATKDEELFLEFSTRDIGLIDKLSQKGVVTFFASEQREYTLLTEGTQWTVPDTSLYIIDPRLQVYSYQQLWNIDNYLTLSQYQINTTGTVQLLVKTNGTVVAERTITINNGVVNQEYFAIQANRGEQLSFELVANPAQLANLLSKKEAAVYSAPTQQSILSPQFTQWSIPEEIIYRQNWPIASAIDSIKKEANISVTLKQPAGQPKGKKDLKMSKGQVEEESFVLQPQAGDEMVIGADIDSAAAKMSQQVIAVLFNPYTSQHNTITEATQWTVPATGNYTVNSQLIANSAINGSVLLTLKKAGNIIDQADIVITDGIVSNVSFDILANKGDVLQFELTPSNASLMSQFSQTVLEVMVPKVIGYSMPVEFHSATTSQLVGQPYRGWSVFGYNGNKEAAELPIQITAADLTADGLRTSVTELQTAMANGTLEQDFDPNKLQLKLLPFFPELETQRWNGPDNHAWVQATQLSSSRKGRDSIVVPKIDDFVNCLAPTKLRITHGKSLSQAEVTGATTESETVTSIDYMDMNGDGFPDLVVNYGIQNTKMTGGLETSRRQIDGLKHVSQSGATATNSEAANFSQANGDRIQTEMPSLGTTGKLLEGGTKKVLQLRDLNADGLPDRLTYTDNQLWVEWGLGYRFTEPELFGAANPTTQHQGEVIDDPTKTNYNSGPYSRAAGESQARYTAASTGELLDINGDGLPDWVTVDDNDPTVFHVALNTGNGFLAQLLWPSSLKQGLSTHSSLVNGEGRYNTNGMGMDNVVSRDYLIMNQGNYSNQDINRTEIQFTDLDGDGYVDALRANQEHQPISMGRNPIGRTNLLKRVHRPLGASLEVQYQRRGNAYQQPFSRWVLSRVEVNDGHPGDGVDVQATTYQYDQCQFQRQERELYGSQQVIEERRDLSQGDNVYRTLTRLFHNNSFYSQGLLQKEILADANGNKYLETEHSYQLQDIDTNQALVNIEHLTATVFPQLRRTDKRFYEGKPNPGKSTSIYYRYDSWGNISNTNDQAELGTPNDDVVTSYEYFQDIARYIVGKPNRITIKGGNMVMRRRESELELGTGNIKQFRQYLAGGEAAITDFEHDQYGNVIRVTGPANHKGQRYSLVYTYDGQVHTHKVSTTDSFGYTSTANYNLKYAQVENTTDINNNSLDYTYDQFGRIATLVGPYQTGTGQYTASYEYHPEAQVPWALSQYIDVYRNDPIETVQFSDGLKRIVQTKKDATSASNAQDVMIVSGHLTFDFVGRTVEQYYPITEPLGSQGVFNSGVDSVQPTRMVYDVLDRNTSTTIPDNTSTLTEYDFGSDREGQTQFLTTVTDANSNSKETYRDVRDLITTVQQFNNGDSGLETISTSYEYDPMKQIVRVMDDHRNQTTAIYDHFGRRIQFNSPDMGLIKTDYDLASNVIRKITPNLLAEGQAIVYDYDYNRLNSISYPNYSGNNVNYTYGAPGAAQNRANRIVMVSDQSGSEERFYGPLGETVKTIKTIASETQGNSANSPEVYTTEYVYDTWGLLQSLTYPDGEVLTHQYNAGGLLSAAFGDKDGHHYSYIKQLQYDKFEKRVFVELGNLVRSHYSYNPLNRRLATLKTGIGTGNLFQDLSYQYDPVGNITGLANLAAVTSSNEKGGATQYQYQYDDLYRLTHAEGTFDYKQSKQHRYQLDMTYDSIHNITAKNQQHQISQSSGNETPQKKTSYDWEYSYWEQQPHAPRQIGERALSYDANGNLTGWTVQDNDTRRAIVWDEENRIQSISDNGHTMTYKYNDVGRRVMKKGPQGDTVYVNSYFTIRNREVGTKHIYAGNVRMVSKMMKKGTKTPLEKDLYFYHPDHLGSSAYVTDAQGGIYQHLEYFPFGDTFVEQVSNTQRTPYWFTAKELDEETGLYYVEARYYDPRTSVWLSTDPILDDYLDGSPNNGVFEPMNLGLFTYVANSPVMYVDPDGRCSVWYSSWW